jgi:phage shock protein E
MGFFSNLFGGNSEALTEALSKGAEVIDVRSEMEYRGGHAKGSKNIPLGDVPRWLENQDKAKPLVFCCASGARSGKATSLAKSSGFDAVNAGPWTNVK